MRILNVYTQRHRGQIAVRQQFHGALKEEGINKNGDVNIKIAITFLVALYLLFHVAIAIICAPSATDPHIVASLPNENELHQKNWRRSSEFAQQKIHLHAEEFEDVHNFVEWLIISFATFPFDLSFSAFLMNFRLGEWNLLSFGRVKHENIQNTALYPCLSVVLSLFCWTNNVFAPSADNACYQGDINNDIILQC